MGVSEHLRAARAVILTVDYGDRHAATFSALATAWGIPFISKFATSAEQRAAIAVPMRVHTLICEAMGVAHDPQQRNAKMDEARAVLDAALAADVAAGVATFGRAAA